MLMNLERFLAYFSAATWLKDYSRSWLANDITAGCVTAVLLIPQGMAYAMLAGLPPEVGLYASILPPLVYAFLGTSRTLSVGPVSVAALLVANALVATGAEQGQPTYLQDALLLAVMSGGILLLMALLRLNTLVNFIGHPVLSGFTSGAAVLIVFSQLQNLTGIAIPQGGDGVGMIFAAAQNALSLHGTTAILGVLTIVLLLAFKSPLLNLLKTLGIHDKPASFVSRGGPLIIIALLGFTVFVLQLHEQGVEIIGNVPAGFPKPNWSFFTFDRAMALLPFALMISLIGYVESVSVAKVLAYRRREKINNNRELIALGMANVAAAFSGAMPVAGGFSRSMVNFSAGAQTQLAAVITAVLVGVATAFFTPLFYYLPKAALAAVIVVAVAPLLDWRTAIKTFSYSRADGAALLTTFFGVLVFDIEIGLIAGVIVGISTFLWRSSDPHIAVVGRIRGTEHFRNIKRHDVETWPQILMIRIDRSLFFTNVSSVEDAVAREIQKHSEVKHLVLLCSGINTLDYSALEALERLIYNLRKAGIDLHLAEVKGPVMDRIKPSGFLETLAPGGVFLSAEEAVKTLSGSN
jgi:sulfate permease, SulP family